MTKTKKITFPELVLMNISALYGIRWIAKSTSANFGLGLGAIPSWAIFMALFFIPQALMCAELASSYPSDGGLATWVKAAFGTKYGFMVSWLNWTAKIFWYASFLTFFAVNISYMSGKPELASNKLFVLAISLALFWLLSFASMKGMAFGKLFTSVGALGSTIPTIILISTSFLAILVFKSAPSASTYTAATMMPQLNGNSLVAISGIIFAYTGAEVTANFVTEIDNPKKNYPRAIILSAIAVCVLYILGSIAITMVLPPSEITASTGILDSLARVCAILGLPPFLVQVIAAGIALSIIGALILYIASPLKMLFGNAEKGIFPEKITKSNEYGIPQKAVILQAVIVTVLLLATSLLPGVNTIYNVLVTMTALTSLFPYILLFLAYIRFKKQKKESKDLYAMTQNKRLGVGLAWMELCVCTVAILMSAFPVMGSLKDNIIYEIEMIGGGILVILSGLYIWKRSGLANKAGVIPKK